ncbi:MAG: hypothetical protein ACRC3J_05210 [Culicoidibacterales bacterium]
MKLMIATTAISVIIVFMLSVVVYFQYNSNLKLSADVSEQRVLNQNKTDAILTLEQDIRVMKQAEFTYQTQIQSLNIETRNAKKDINQHRNKQEQIKNNVVQAEQKINEKFKSLTDSLACETGLLCD